MYKTAALCSVVALSLVGSCEARTVARNGTAPTPVRDQITIEGGTFFDEKGRERYFRGVNVVYKDAPWIPVAPTFDPDLSFVEDDVDLLVSLGVNLLRLGVMWPGLFPHSRDTVDKEYIKKVQKMIRMSASKGIYVILEPHQDEMNPR
jgi:endoglycosylceramidase